jgi:putative oxygen-independent coproporphyrinogen III oxidase
MLQFSELPALGLYLHFPWCVRKCPYCDFNSHEIKDDLPEKIYINALIADLERELPAIWGRSIHSIFMGGGTPSLFSPESLDILLSDLRARLNFSAETEITLEANPGTVEKQRFADYRAIGINRLSIGIQSFNDEQLTKLGRIHTSREAIKAVEAAHDAGFTNFNLDLMYGLPGQTSQQAINDIQTAIDLEPMHLSHYQLTIEPNTWFYHHPPVTPDDDYLAEIETACRERLASHDYARYEISAFAKDNMQCKHNINYWMFGDYLGIGAGAHGKRTDAQQQQIIRTHKQRHPQRYIEASTAGNPVAGRESPDTQTIVFEFMLNALRLTDGFDSALFQQRCGMPISQVESKLRTAEQDGLIEWKLHRIVPTAKGLLYHNDLLERFLPDNHDEAD